ncbi:MAG: right-handed parallel beta-helix repeat-containing protein [Bacteroidales bacterium]|nr:right-handed parallel beta-helix repeat-containing protein [Bacteroidales bacterium]
MKRILMLALLASMAFFAACEKDDDNNNENKSNEEIITGNITQNTTWETGKVYILGSRVAVVSGITLTIQPGVIVKGQAGTGSNATALIIARGAKIMAEGTATQPIIFTSVADEIEPGQIASPNLDPSLNGLWGGLLILGNAPISAESTSMQIEGIPASDQNGLYGGSNATDNSGVIKFVSIRHGGANIGEGNEINGLTLGGVGSGTVIENIEIVSNQDDGIEWFGGSVTVKNAIVWNTGDDAIDTDQAWSGTLDNFVVINPGDECFELDGPEGSAKSIQNHIIKNGSVYAGNAEGLVDLDPNSNVDMNNIYFFGIKAGQDFDELPTIYTCSFANLQVTLPESTSVTDFFKKGSDEFVTAVAAGQNTVGADVTKFKSWSWADAAKALADF